MMQNVLNYNCRKKNYKVKKLYEKKPVTQGPEQNLKSKNKKRLQFQSHIKQTYKIEDNL